jgi:N6-adenosine-specific RNA methylase IME4
MNVHFSETSLSLLETAGSQKYRTVRADPPWRFINRTGKVAPEHRRLNRYGTMSTDEICELPVQSVTQATSHLYMWVPNALLPDGLRVMQSW